MAARTGLDRSEPRRGLGSRAAWTLVDQAISSFSNAGLSILVARSVDASSFGAFGIAFVAFTFVIGIVRAQITDPLVIRFSTAAPRTLRLGAQQSAGASLVTGVVTGLLCALIAVALGGELGVALLALGLCLPGLLVQDAWRHAFFALGRPAAAAVNDLACAVVQFALIAVALLTGHGTVLVLMLAWGLGAVTGGLVGVAQISGWPLPGATVSWIRSQRDLGTRLGLDFFVNMGAYNVAIFVVGGVAGLTAAGSLRAAQTILGPLQVLFSSLAAFVVPTFARLALGGAHRLLAPALAMSAAAAISAGVWLVVLLLLPTSAGEALLGDSWHGAREVLPGMGVVSGMTALAIGAALSLKALGRAGTLLRCTLVQAPLILVLAVLGAVEDGARGAATGFALAHVVGTVVFWLGARSALSSSARPRSC